jgi:carbamoyl-phosphate synthase large subunit
MPIKILVSGAAGDTAQGILKSLKSSSLDVELYTTCIHKHSSWLHVERNNSFIAPLSSDKGYVDYLIRLIRRFKIDVYFPTVDSEIAKITLEKARIERKTGALVFADDLKRVSVCDDKILTVDFLRTNNFAYPKSIAADDRAARDFVTRLGFPVIAKKRSGQGSQNVYRVDGPGQLEQYCGNPTFILQEWLDPALGEYTTGLYLGDDGSIKGVSTFRRMLRGGSTFIAERIINPKLEKPLENMTRKLGMKYLNIQSIRRGDHLVPFEFNGRLSGSTAMVAKIFNAPEMFIRERLLGESLDRIDDKAIFVAMRYYEEVYATLNQIDLLEKRSAGI